jgi:predicted ATPase
LIAALLSKTRAERHDAGNAQEINAAMFRAFDMTPPPETVAIRESFLQSAHFVGRKEEMKALSEALGEAIRGKGSAWLIGGESGAGKSRLLGELRVLAQVSGALVATAQAITEASAPYTFWVDVLRRLSLSVDPNFYNDLRTSVIETVVTDLTVLIGRDVAPVPAALSMDIESARTRLHETVIELFRRQPQPVVILLEDLHWASAESKALLESLVKAAPELPLLIVGTYRDDVTPDLSGGVPLMKPIRLGRLGKSEIADLSASILGSVGRRQAIIDLLERETEGNVFLLVEVIRTLAEEAGQLSKIGTEELPATVFVGGMQEMVERRLNRVPEAMRPLLRIAAVIGRQVDLKLMRRIEPNANLAEWLTACADAAVLEVSDDPAGGEWRFAHNKLREGVLDSIPPNERAEMHRRAAAALEWVAVDPEEYALLAYHWGAAKDEARERDYLALAADHAWRGGAYRQAREFGERAMLLARKAIESDPKAIDPAWMARLNAALGWAYSGLGDYVPSRRCFEEQLTIFRALNDLNGIADALGNLAGAAWRMGNYQEAWQYATDSEAMFRALDNDAGVAWSLETLSRLARWLGEPDLSRRYAQEAVEIYQSLGNRYGVADAYNNLGLVSQMMGDFEGARAQFQESLRMIRQIGATAGSLHHTLNNLGIVAAALGRFDEAQSYFDESLAIARETGNQRMIANVLSNLGNIALQQKQYLEARRHLDESLAVAYAIGYKRIISWALSSYGALELELGLYPAAEIRYQASLDTALELGERWLIANAIGGLGDVDRAREDHAAAWAKYREALTIFDEIKAKPSILFTFVSMARLLRAEGNPQRAAELMGLVLAQVNALNAEGRRAAESLVSDMRFDGLDRLDEWIKQGEGLNFEDMIRDLLGNKGD